MTTRIRIRVGLATLLAAAGIATYLSLNSTTAQGSPGVPSAAEQHVIENVTAFATPATAADEVHGTTALAGSTRRIGQADTGAPVWAALSSTQLCVQVGEAGASSCMKPENLGTMPLIVAGGRSTTGGAVNTPEEVAGLVPNGIDAITIAFANGTSETVAVTNNGFYSAIKSSIAGFKWTTPQGAVEKIEVGGQAQ
jgi:hypothetical protein